MLKFPLRISLLLLLPLGAASGAEEWGQCHVWPAPVFDYPGEDRGGLSPSILGADSSESSDGNNLIKLFGNITVQRPHEQLFADEALYDRALRTLEASGNIRYETPDLTTQADRARIDLESGRGAFENSRYIVPSRHARGGSRAIRIEGDGVTVLEDASYTTCDPGNEEWLLRASSVNLDQRNGMGSAWNARLSFQGVPFFYIPYIRFPITNERMTGLLAPTIGSTQLGGTEVAVPFYLNLHPQLDATITPRNYSERGLKWDGELRYLSRYGEGMVHSERLDDRVYGAERTLYEYRHAGRLAAGWSGDILFHQVSDRDYFNDFGNSLSVSSLTHLERHVRLNYGDARGRMVLQAQDYQTIDDTTPYSSRPYRRLPQLAYTLAPQSLGPLRLGFNGEVVRFQQRQHINASRLNLMPSLSLPYQRPAGFLIPQVSLSHTRYWIEDEGNTLGVDRLERTLPIGSLDGGLYFERDTELFGRAYLQTLEPRAFYVYIPYRDQSNYPLLDSGRYDFNNALLFRPNRFAGVDRIGDTEQVTVALTSRLLRHSDGWELIRASAGQIQYLADRRVELSGNQFDGTPHSETIVDGELRPNRDLSLRGALYWNSDDDTVTRRDLRLQYMSDNRHIINLSYRQRGNPVSDPNSVSRELDGSILWPLGSRWSLIGRRYHSLTDDRTLEKLAGFEYNDCCWAFRAMRRATFIEDGASTTPPFGTLRYSWYLQLELKGLTSLGDSIDAMMQDKIVGYTAIP